MKRFGLLGHPVAHSISPRLHQAAYNALGLAHEYALIDCPTEQELALQVERLKAGELAGANITLPHKVRALSLASLADPLAERTGAANTLVREGSQIVAYNTDVLALITELSSAPKGVLLVLGAGGAALAAVAAGERLGFKAIYVTARKFINRGGSPTSSWPNAESFQRLGAKLVPWQSEESRRAAIQASLIVQATSSGLAQASSEFSLKPSSPASAARSAGVHEVIPWLELSPEAQLYDVVYNPLHTAFLAHAEGLGLKARGGLSMLVEQAALALELWLPVEAPREIMREAAFIAMSGRANAEIE